jgi:hypothetical protein
MSDIYLVQLQDEIPLTQVQPVLATATSPRALVLRGRNFDRIIEVVVNDESIIEGWTQRSATELYVPLPDLLQTATILTVAAYSQTVHDMESSRLVFRVGSGERVAGVQYAVQLVVKWLFTDVGTDAWNPGAGGGWSRALKYVQDREDYTSVMPDLIEGLRRVTSFIQDAQSKDPAIRPAERIARVEIVRSMQIPRGVRVVMELETVGRDKALFAVRK